MSQAKVIRGATVRTPNVWGSEDGDRWFAEGHIDREVMILLVVAFEEELLGEDCCNEILELKGDLERGAISHYFVRWNPDDEEAPGTLTSSEDPDGVPMTMICRG